MEIRNASENDIIAAAHEVGVNVHNLHKVGRAGFALTLKLGPSNVVYKVGARGRVYTRAKYTRTSTNRSLAARSVAAVCWHGHRDFMRALYRRAPSAIIRTAMAKYLNAAHFEAAHESTKGGYANPYAVPFADACHCAEDAANGTPTLTTPAHLTTP